MHHLTLEDLARLVEETPAVAEAEHLRDCLVCRRELEGLREQTSLLAGLPVLEAPAAGWAALEGRLLEERLLHTPAPSLRPSAGASALRIAAALALFVAGGAAGALLWNRGAEPGGVAVLDPAPVERPAQRVLPQPLPAADPVSAGTDARLVANESAPERAAPRASPRPRRSAAVQRAEQELAEAEAAYLAALHRYAELADPGSGADPLTRLEALDALVLMSARALERAPESAPLNGYHLAAVNERDALRRQIQRAAESVWF